MRLSFRIALRFLSSSRGQSLLILLGIGIGVSVQVFIGSLIQGLQASLVDATIGNASQITIRGSNEAGTMEGWQEIIQQILAEQSEVTAITGVTDAPGFIEGGARAYPVLARGLDLTTAEGIYQFSERIFEGNLPVSAKEILLGKELAETLALRPGDALILQTPQGKRNTFQVSGLYDLKVASINNSWVILPQEAVQDLFGLDGLATGIEIQVQRVFEADRIGEEIRVLLQEAGLSEAVEIEDWKALNEQLLTGLNGQSVSSLMIQVFVMVSVVLGIASVLAITVVQKSRQIGILKAMGIRDRSASLIFLFQGMLLGIGGALLGVLFGLGLALAFSTFALNPDGTPVVPLTINGSFIAASAGIAVLAAMTASLLPARRSSRLNPIEVIRNG